MMFWAFVLRPDLGFFRTALGCFSQCNFKIVRRRPTVVTDIFTPYTPSHHEKSSYGPV